jgi:NTP pyrophosphatase (non-canonical NTP hydrolase)
MQISEFQKLIESLYLEKDRARGVDRTFLWFAEEVGELAEAVRTGDREALKAEFADVLAWLSTLASLTGVNLETAAVDKYRPGCPKCSQSPCNCPEPGTT